MELIEHLGYVCRRVSANAKESGATIGAVGYDIEHPLFSILHAILLACEQLGSFRLAGMPP